MNLNDFHWFNFLNVKFTFELVLLEKIKFKSALLGFVMKPLRY